MNKKMYDIFLKENEKYKKEIDKIFMPELFGTNYNNDDFTHYSEIPKELKENENE